MDTIFVATSNRTFNFWQVRRSSLQRRDRNLRTVAFCLISKSYGAVPPPTSRSNRATIRTREAGVRGRTTVLPRLYCESVARVSRIETFNVHKTNACTKQYIERVKRISRLLSARYFFLYFYYFLNTFYICLTLTLNDSHEFLYYQSNRTIISNTTRAST